MAGNVFNYQKRLYRRIELNDFEGEISDEELDKEGNVAVNKFKKVMKIAVKKQNDAMIQNQTSPNKANRSTSQKPDETELGVLPQTERDMLSKIDTQRSRSQSFH